MVNDIVRKHESDKNIISILQSIQEKYGYIPEKQTAKVAYRLNLPLVKFWGIATFYSQFRLQKQGKYVIRVCDGTACHVNRSEELLEFLKENLEIDVNQTTKDNIFTLETVNCIGACARAPAIMINETVYGNLDIPKLKKLLENFRK